MREMVTSSYKSLFLFFLLTAGMSVLGFAQSGQIVGNVKDAKGEAVPFASVSIDAIALQVLTDLNGDFLINNVPEGEAEVTVRSIGFVDSKQSVLVVADKPTRLDVTLQEKVETLGETVVEVKTKATQKKEEAYAVEVIETKELQNREVNVNQLATQSAGIRVRESGGLGSKFTYSLNGMSGNAVRFFVDGVPIDRFGAGYSVNNFPVNLIDRIELYKGVVPPQFGSDALGGVINIISKKKYSNYLDASYSYGSFNTHRASVSTRLVNDSARYFVDFQGFYNYSDNDYKVWGKGVEVADPETGKAIEIETRRFHDAYRSLSGKLDFGLVDRKWADQFKIGVLYAGSHNELQHGATMASVIGEATQNSQSFSPTMSLSKKNAFVKGLDLNLYNSISWLSTETIDTSSRIYDWNGKVIFEHPTNSELGQGGNGKSMLTLNSLNNFHQLNLAYSWAEKNRLNFNYTLDAITRDGEDPLVGNRTATFREPQSMTKQVSSLAYERSSFEGKLDQTVWVKNYDFRVSTVDTEYITDSLGYRPIGVPIGNKMNRFGYGYAVKYKLKKRSLLKLSLEKCYRLPTAEEMLGDGLFLQNNPELMPEESWNLNVNWLLSGLPVGKSGHLSVEPSLFFRNTENLILYTVQNNVGMGHYQNIGKVRGMGGSLDIKYRYKNFLVLSGNATYQQMRDWMQYKGANLNQTYKDLLRNTPYLMANMSATVKQEGVFKDDDQVSLFWDVMYVHEFFLNWPSLGDPNTKSVIPTQLVNGAGVSYSFKSGKYNLSFSCNNLFNEQVYDNYLLQKPGRSFSTKLRVFLN